MQVPALKKVLSSSLLNALLKGQNYSQNNNAMFGILDRLSK